MDEKQKYFLNRSLLRQSIDEQDQQSDRLLSSTIVSHKRRRSPTINDQFDLFSNPQHLTYNQNILPPPTRTSQKRSIHENYLIPEYDQHVNKRVRYEQPNNIELENQPPRSTIKRRSVFLYHPRQDWNNLQIQNDIPLSFDQLSTYHRLNNPYEQNLSNHFSPCDIYTEHLTNQNLSMFQNESLTTSARKSSSMNIVKNNIHLLTPQSNVPSPLRTTNFVLDSKQQAMSATIMRTGNISPAHSDTSIESTSTCSSDEQQTHPNFPLFHYNLHHQPSSRSYRERENYEQLLDLAEKLSDPNRLKKIDIEQFFSYRYKALPTTTDILSSKQTACVICMSHFKNGQRIRILPCQHEYHTKCIARWFTMNSSCPICRRDNFLSTC